MGFRSPFLPGDTMLALDLAKLLNKPERKELPRLASLSAGF
jgi:hypothetical protein